MTVTCCAIHPQSQILTDTNSRSAQIGSLQVSLTSGIPGTHLWELSIEWGRSTLSSSEVLSECVVFSGA